MSESPHGWQNWTKATKASELEGVRQELEQIRKWQRTHLGPDFAASGVDYPHPSQRVRTLVFFEGNGRLDPTGIQILSGTTTDRGIFWVLEYADNPFTALPVSFITALIDEPVASNYVVSNFIESRATSVDYRAVFKVSAADASSGESSIIQGTATFASDAAYFILLVDGTNKYFQLNDVPLYLAGVTSDFTALSDGMLWYRSDLDRFRARANGVTENLAYESDIPTSSNVQPFAAKTTTYTTTNADGVISVDATSASFTVTLVTAVGNSGLTQTFKKINAANVVTIDANSTQTIDGLTTYALSAQWSWVTLVSNGSNWLITGAG